MEEIEREFAYRTRWSIILLCSVFFGFCAAVLGFKAAGNDRGLNLFHLVEVGPGWATGFYWLLTAASVVFVILCGVLTVHRLTVRQRLAFTPTALLMPASFWSAVEIEVPYSEVIGLSDTNVNGSYFLTVLLVSGKQVVNGFRLPSKAIYGEVCELLATKVQAARDRR